ncbi:MAG: OmpA family protein [Gammaproteobacteria bacterium]
MRQLRRFMAAVLLPVFVAGCASGPLSGGPSSSEVPWCAVAGAVAGAAAGGASGEVAGGVFGAAGGAVLGEVFCVVEGEAAELDSDGDGVPDSRDKCPDTPAAAYGTVDADGCPKYSDGDDVPDYLDQCPGTPAGVAVDDRGCPTDSDGDGVPDEIDRCPNTRAGSRVDDRGCPQVGETFAIVTNVNFEFDSAVLRADARPKIDDVISGLRASPSVNVAVVGHTDAVGSAAYNQSLSEQRAASVRTYMISNGIDASRLRARGEGESRPMVSNNTAAGRAVNRRVEFEVIE